MAWHYQLRKRCDKDNVYYDIIEMYEPDQHDSDRAWTLNGIQPLSDTLEEMVSILQMMLADIQRYPVFEEPACEW